MRIGIVGAENSHTIAIAKTLNLEKAVPGFEVTHVWGETTESAAKAAEAGGIPRIVDDPKDMIGAIEGAVVDHRHAKYHLPAVRPLVEAGIPVFVDKPFCMELSEGIEFVRFARQRGVPVTSYSVLPLQKSVHEFGEAMGKLGNLRSFVTAGPADIDSEYGGIFFYGIHQVDLMLSLVAACPVSVSTTRQGESGVATIAFDSGAFGVLHCLKDWSGGFLATAYGDSGVHHSPMSFDENAYLEGIRTFCRMFETRKEPFSPSAYLRPVAVLTSMQKSFDTGRPVEVEEVEI